MRHHPALVFAVLAVALMIASTLPCSAVVYVKWDSLGTVHDGMSWDTAFQTVQAGLNAATPGDEVWVAKGTYVECITLSEGLGLYGGFAGTEMLRDDRDWSANTTTLDGNQAGAVVTSPSGATPATRLDGFTIRNGARGSGGIYCRDSSSPTIANNTIIGNVMGIFCLYSSPMVTDNTVTGNKYGISCLYSSPTVTNNTLSGNDFGIDCLHESSPKISRCVISGNALTAIGCKWRSSPTIVSNAVLGNGMGILCTWECSPTITDNEIVENAATGIQCSSESSPTITGNVIRANRGGIGCSLGSCPTITGNTISGNARKGIDCFHESSPTIADNVISENVWGA